MDILRGCLLRCGFVGVVLDSDDRQRTRLRRDGRHRHHRHRPSPASSTAQPIQTDRHRYPPLHTLRTSTTALPACVWVLWSFGMIHTTCTRMVGGPSEPASVCLQFIQNTSRGGQRRARDATCLGHRLGLVAAEDEPARADAGGGGEALGDDRLGRGGVDGAVVCVSGSIWSFDESVRGLCVVYLVDGSISIDQHTRSNSRVMATYGWRKKSIALALIRRSASSREMSPSLNCSGLGGVIGRWGPSINGYRSSPTPRPKPNHDIHTSIHTCTHSASTHHVHGHLDGRLGRALPRAALQHVELPFLDRELDVL